MRRSLSALSSLGAGGRGAGQFCGIGSVATEAEGNIYTGETYEGKRLQKFAFTGAVKPGTPASAPRGTVGRKEDQ